MGKILDALRTFPDRFKRAKGRNLTEAAAFLQAQWKLTLAVNGTPRNPSRPGQPPHNIYGGVMNKVSVVANLASMLLEMKYGSDVASYLDHGTRKMLARPHRTPTLERCRPRLYQILGKK